MNRLPLRAVVCLELFMIALLPLLMPRIATAADPFIGTWAVAPASGTEWESGGTITVAGASKADVKKYMPANGANDQSQIQCLGFEPGEPGRDTWPDPSPLSWYVVTFSWKSPTMGGCSNQKSGPNSVALFGLPRGAVASISASPDGSLSGCWSASGTAGCAAFRASISEGTEEETKDPTGPAVVISGLSRKVQVQRQDGGWEPAADTTRLIPGDKIHTGYKAGATLTFPDGSTLTLKPMTLIFIQAVESSGGRTKVRLWLQLGEVSANVHRPLRGTAADFEVKTPTLTTSVRGTKFDVSYDEKTTIVAVTEGTVNVQPTNTALAAFDVSEGSETSVSAESASLPEPISSQEKPSNNMLPLLTLAAIVIAGGGAYLWMRRKRV